jgi:hypothetical protein
VSGIREVGGADLDDWDTRAVDAPGGHVYQSRAWGEFQAGLGWRVRYLRFDDGFPVLVLQRRWPWIGGWSAYVSRGPVPTGSPTETAERQVELADWLAGRGVSVVGSKRGSARRPVGMGTSATRPRRARRTCGGCRRRRSGDSPDLNHTGPPGEVCRAGSGGAGLDLP